MREWVGRQFRLGGVLASFLLPFGGSAFSADCTRPSISEKAVYEQAQRLHARIKRQEQIVVQSEDGSIVSSIRPDTLSAVPIEFFIRYRFCQGLAIPIQLSRLFKIAQHIRNFYKDPAVYQEGFEPETQGLLRNKELNRYMVYVLHVYSLNLHRTVDIPTVITKEQAIAEGFYKAISFEEDQEVNAPISWGVSVEIHIRRLQYALWALQALSEIGLNLSTFGITYPEINALLAIAIEEFGFAVQEFRWEEANHSALISEEQFIERTQPFVDRFVGFQNRRWNIDPTQIRPAQP